MISSFILAAALAFVSFYLGGYLVKVAMFTGMTKVALLLLTCWVTYWLYRRITRGRRSGVRKIPRL